MALAFEIALEVALYIARGSALRQVTTAPVSAGSRKYPTCTLQRREPGSSSPETALQAMVPLW